MDLSAVAANTRLLARRATGELMAVVKADGYGHGAVPVARTALANGATWLGVTSLAEALELRAAGLDAPLLSWLNPVDVDVALAHRARVDLAVTSLDHLRAFIGAAEAGAGRSARGPVRLHLHLDCGMTRDGVPLRDWPRLMLQARAAERHGLVQVVALMGHLGCSDTPDDPCNARSRELFVRARQLASRFGLITQHRHLATTAATLTDPLSQHTMARVGAGLVGIDPSGSTRLSPALTLRAPLLAVQRVEPGTTVGYGHAWRAERATRLGLIPIGYGDGLPRAAAGRAQVLVRSRRCPVVGRLSMDQLVVDLGAVPAGPGDVATVFGPGTDGEPTVADWAGWSGTIAHEIVTGLGRRLHRSTVTHPLTSVL